MNENKLITLVELIRELNSSDNNVYTYKEEYYNLLMEMGTFISKTCGNLNKIYEKTVQLDLLIKYEKDANENKVEHVKDSYGADLIIVDKGGLNKQNVEVKVSSVEKKKGFRANWNFTVNLRKFNLDDTDDIENRLFRHIYKRQYSGIVYVAAVNDGKTLYSCTLSGLFVSLLLTKMTIKGKTYSISEKKINLGSLYCCCHQTYHRMVKFSEYDVELTKRMIKMDKSELPDINTIFNDFEWKELLQNTIQCKK